MFGSLFPRLMLYNQWTSESCAYFWSFITNQYLKYYSQQCRKFVILCCSTLPHSELSVFSMPRVTQALINVVVERARYLMHPDFPWIAISHDALVYSGCRISLHVRGAAISYRVTLSWIVRITATQVVYYIYHKPVGCPQYIAFPRPPYTLQQPRISPERLDEAAEGRNFTSFMNFWWKYGFSFECFNVFLLLF